MGRALTHDPVFFSGLATGILNGSVDDPLVGIGTWGSGVWPGDCVPAEASK